jgi:hypothetical protein
LGQFLLDTVRQFSNLETVVKVRLSVSLALLVFLLIGLSVMGIRTILDPGRFDFFEQIGLPRVGVLAWAVYTVVGALLMAHPRTLVVGCVMLLLNNLFIIGVYVKAGKTSSVAFEALAMAFPIALLWLGHPYNLWMQRLES